MYWTLEFFKNFDKILHNRIYIFLDGQRCNKGFESGEGRDRWF